MKPWEAKLGFFWYNDEEIFHFSKKDFDEKAKTIADSGINIVMTFSCTHFRWSFMRYWDKILKCIENTVQACHAHNIKAVEHHSSHLTFNPQTDAQMSHIKKVLAARKSDLSSWPKLVDDMHTPLSVDGHSLADFRQIDGRTGDYARSSYNGFCMCFNNPNYERAYFSYLERVYATGVDGIMTDDVQFFGDGHACACVWCQKKFREQTGLTLPDPGEAWDRFWKDFDHTTYVSWEKFRKQSTSDFQRRVNAHFEKMDYEMLRPNYVSSAINSNPTGYAFHYVADLWDWIFQENCLAHMIRLSWPHWYTESLHRCALAHRNNVPSMSLFYPNREDSYYFVWALAHSWGQMLTVTYEGFDLSSIEKKYRAFEKKHAPLLDNPIKVANIAVLFSTDTAYYTENKEHARDLFAWTQAAYFSNIPCDMVFSEDDVQTLARYNWLIAPDVTMMDDALVERLMQYVEQGGQLLILGMPAQKNTDGMKRSVAQIAECFGFDCEPLQNKRQTCDVICSVKDRQMTWKQTIEMAWPSEVDSAFASTDDQTVGRYAKIGSGTVWWLPNAPHFEPYGTVSIDTRTRMEEARESPSYSIKQQLMEHPGKLLQSLGSPIFTLHEMAEDRLVSLFFTSDRTRMVFHVVDTYEAIPQKTQQLGHFDPIPAFTKEYQPVQKEDGKIRLKAGVKIKKAVLHTPEKDQSIEISVHNKAKDTWLVLPKKAFRSYALIECILDKAD